MISDCCLSTHDIYDAGHPILCVYKDEEDQVSSGNLLSEESPCGMMQLPHFGTQIVFSIHLVARNSSN